MTEWLYKYLKLESNLSNLHKPVLNQLIIIMALLLEVNMNEAIH